MTSFHSFLSRCAVCLLAPLTAVVLALPAAVPARAAATQAGIEVQQPIYVLPAKPSELLRAPLTAWKPLLAEVSATLKERAKEEALLSIPALIELNVQRTVAAQMQQDWPAVLDAVGKSRQLQGSESGRQTAGLLNELLARQTMGGGDAAWLQRHLRDKVLAMPWEEVEGAIQTLRQQLASAKAEAIEAFVSNKLDLSASAAQNKANLGFVVQLMAMRFQLLEVMPHQKALVAGLDEAIAQRMAAAASAATK